jgi:uncharacterized OB-fold protein
MDEKPLPRMTSVNRPFLEACNEGRLVLQHCTDTACGKAVFYPRVCCPYCGGCGLEWREVAPAGRVLSFTLVHRPQHEVFYNAVPVPFAAVELDAGPLIYGELTAVPGRLDDLLGAPVRVVFRDHARGQKLPYFELKV